LWNLLFRFQETQGDPMRRQLTVVLVGAALLSVVVLGMVGNAPAQARRMGQQPTVAIPTVTSTPSGPKVIVNADQDQINVRSGPGTEYSKVGVLVSGQEVEALGRSSRGLWLLIRYIGAPEGTAWVYSPLVSAPSGNLPIIEPPPSPTPQVTPTIDPTLAAQFIVEAIPTRLPTFTPPPPLVIPTLDPTSPASDPTAIPMGMVIIGLAVLGFLGSVISLLRGR
jgi:hypothetical protein